MRQEVDSAGGVFCAKEVREWQDQTLNISTSSPLVRFYLDPPFGRNVNERLYTGSDRYDPRKATRTWINIGIFALAKRCTTARSRSGKTPPIACPAFRNRCMIKSPTKIPPDSENCGSRKRARRWNMAVKPGVPSDADLRDQLRHIIAPRSD